MLEEIKSGPQLQHYRQGSFDGKTKHKIMISTIKPERVNKIGFATLMAHEGIPGHHLQKSVIGKKQEYSHSIMGLIGLSNFTEGWAIYAESLVHDELVLGEEAYLWYLSGRASGFTRLQLDIGIHQKKWTRPEGIEFLKKFGYGEGTAGRVVDRLSASPASTMSYYIGALTFVELKSRAQKELGQAFDIKEFHREVLKNGEIPIQTLKDNIEKWLVAEKALSIE